jgi:hypothetical protein
LSGLTPGMQLHELDETDAEGFRSRQTLNWEDEDPEMLFFGVGVRAADGSLSACGFRKPLQGSRNPRDSK